MGNTSEYMKQYYKDHSDIIKERSKRYSDDHPEYIRKKNAILNSKWNPINHPRQLTFKCKILTLKQNPRIGVCNLCRNVVPFDCKRTHIHHESYHNDDPLKDTLELCISCHNKQRSKP